MFQFPCIISLYYINNQQDATLAVLFISHCKITTCFGRFLRPLSGVLKTVVAATGASHAVNYKATYKQVLCVIQAVIEYWDVLEYRRNIKLVAIYYGFGRCNEYERFIASSKTIIYCY
jgi:hypothetical protein